MKHSGAPKTSLPPSLTRDPGDIAIVAAAQQSRTADSLSKARKARQEARRQARAREEARTKYTPKTQPRHPDGKFRKILARLKQNLGDESTQDLANEIEAANAAQVAGDYLKMRSAGANIIDRIEEIQSGSLGKGVKQNLRESAEELGEVMAYLPMPQGDPSAKVRFSDIPPAAKDLIRRLVENTEEKVGTSEAKPFTDELRTFMSGGMRMHSDQLASNLNRLMKILH